MSFAASAAVGGALANGLNDDIVLKVLFRLKGLVGVELGKGL